MDRRTCRYGYLLVAIAAALAALPAAGCRTISTALAYMIKGTDVEPDFAGLKGKKVVVVCRPLAQLQVRNAGADREVAKQVGRLLKANVPKITVIDSQKVAKWTDENRWDDFSEVGKAMKAEMVVGIDLTSFNTLDGQTLLRGRADTSIRVYDLSKEKSEQLVWEKPLPQCVYPPNAAIPLQDEPEVQFRRRFIAALADQIARHFYAHDPYADVAEDSRAGLP